MDNPNQAAEQEYVTQVRLGHEVRPGATTLADYDFRDPALKLVTGAPVGCTSSAEARDVN